MAGTAAELARRIAQGRAVAPADLVIKNVRLLDLVTGDLVPTDIAVCGDTIVGTYAAYDGAAVVDGAGRIAVPGFIDTHLHVESSLVTPFEFDRCVLPHGVTTAICDPHEMANVLGTAAFDYFLACAERTVMDLRVQLSSCVPATTLETAGASIGADDLLRYAAHPKVLGLAEFMNFPGVLGGDPGCLDKLAELRGPSHRRPRAAARRPRPQRLCGGRDPHGARGHDGHGSLGEDPQGVHGADPRRIGLEGPSRLGAAADARDVAVPRLLHR